MTPAKKDTRLAALRRFATAITVLNLLGHTVLGFEQSWAHPLVGAFAAYATELILGTLDARLAGRRPKYLNGGTSFVDFLLPAHISGLAVSMLLYANDQLPPIAFAAVVAIASKYIFRFEVDGVMRHFFNPSNLGIAVTLVCFRWVAITPIYMWTENLDRFGDYFLPLFIVFTGSLLNSMLTRRIPLIASWLAFYVLQAVARSLIQGTFLLASLNSMTGVAFVLFTFYMVTDPPTTPASTKGQIAFGASVAIGYGVLMAFDVVFALFFSLCFVCLVRGSYLYVTSRSAARSTVPVAVQV
jgi:Na+-translocating ferredoxin:NAD+ oxidoreductase RnfD subunit